MVEESITTFASVVTGQELMLAKWQTLIELVKFVPQNLCPSVGVREMLV